MTTIVNTYKNAAASKLCLYNRFFYRSVRFYSGLGLNFLSATRVKARYFEERTQLKVGQQRVIQIILRNDPLSRFKRLRKSLMYSRRNKDSRELVPLVGIITYISAFSKKEDFYSIGLFWKTKNVWLTVNLCWGSRNIVGLSTMRPRGLNIGSQAGNRRKNLTKFAREKS